MKNSLRYYITEGFIALIYWPAKDTFKTGCKAFTGSFYTSCQVPLEIKYEDENTVAIIGGVRYVMNDDFYLDYGIFAENQIDGHAQGNKINDERHAARIEFRNVALPQLVEAYAL